MKTHFLFSSNPIRPKVVEEIFSDQFAAVQAAGFSASVLPDSVIKENKLLRNIPNAATVVYRGWILNAMEYARLTEAVGAALATPLTSAQEYLATHHLPNWYPLITEFTPETRIFPSGSDWESAFHSLGWESFFIKDYVKSLKTSRGSIVRDSTEIRFVVSEMQRLRGEIEGGLCIRRVESFIHESEQRYFVLYGKPFSPNGQSVPDIVKQVATRISSPFFSVDVVRRSDGVLRVMEIGDGHVSDLVGWSAQAFAAMWVAARAIV